MKRDDSMTGSPAAGCAFCGRGAVFADTPEAKRRGILHHILDDCPGHPLGEVYRRLQARPTEPLAAELIAFLEQSREGR